MLTLIRKFFRLGTAPDYAALVKAGAVIIDVRSQPEYQGGHINGSVNIPLDKLKRRIQLLPVDKLQPIIVCCASGVRSGQARGFLTGLGYKQVFNGGGWDALQKKLQAYKER